MEFDRQNIFCRILLGLPVTERERAYAILYMGINPEEIKVLQKDS